MLEQEGVGRHDALGHHAARVDQVRHLPGVGVLAADPREVGAGALGAPLERMVVHALGGEAVVAVALGLVAERPDHLAVAVVAALADVDVAAHQLERAVGPHALDLLDRALDREQRRDLDDAADRDRDQGQDEQQEAAGLDLLVAAQAATWRRLLTRPGRRARRPAERPALLGPDVAAGGAPEIVDHDQGTGRGTARRRRPG